MSMFSIFKNRKGIADMTDKIVNMAVAMLILFSLFGTTYASFILANATSVITATHSTLLGIIMTMLIIGFVIMVWRSARGR